MVGQIFIQPKQVFLGSMRSISNAGRVVKLSDPTTYPTSQNKGNTGPLHIFNSAIQGAFCVQLMAEVPQ